MPPVQSAKDVRGPSSSGAIPDDKGSPSFCVTIAAGYRQWELIATSRKSGRLDELGGRLGNAVAMKAYREGTLPFTDIAILGKLAWKHVPSPGAEGAFIPGRAATVQIMGKDSKKYVSTGGWGFGLFTDGKPVDEAQRKICFPCHSALVRAHDFVFTCYAP
jgi:hypothetical protein